MTAKQQDLQKKLDASEAVVTDVRNELANVRHTLGEARTKLGVIENEMKRKEEELSMNQSQMGTLREQLDKATVQRRADTVRMREDINALSAEKVRLEDHLREVKKNADTHDFETHRLETDLANLEAEARELARLLEEAVTKNENCRKAYEGWVSPEEQQRVLTEAQERHRRTLDARAITNAQEEAISKEQYELLKKELDEITSRCDALSAAEVAAVEKMQEERRMRSIIENELIQAQKEADTIRAESRTVYESQQKSFR